MGSRLSTKGDRYSYLDGGWSAPDPLAFMELVHAAGDDIFDGFQGLRPLRLIERARHAFSGNTRLQARRKIASHCDLGNEFYRLWLDGTMTCRQESLEVEQTAKYASLIDEMGAEPGDHVLKIGCGWGGFAEYAAAERRAARHRTHHQPGAARLR